MDSEAWAELVYQERAPRILPISQSETVEDHNLRELARSKVV